MVRWTVDKGTQTIRGRIIRYEITQGFYRWELETETEVIDLATGLEGKARDLEGAIDDLFQKLEVGGEANSTP